MSLPRGRGDVTYEADRQWCFEAVQGVSRTFAITIDVLEEPMASRICVGYLLCRIADTIEDAGHIPPAEQSRLLRHYDRVLDPEEEATAAGFRAEVDEWIPEEPDADWRVVAATPRVVATYETLPPADRERVRGPVRELVVGMADFVDRYDDVGGLRLETVEELEEYCWYAAGTVGTLVTNLLAPEVRGEREATLRDNARSFALLLQLVNVAKDVTDDYREENNVYLPAEWLRAEGVSPEEVTAPGNESAVASVVRRVTDRAAGYLDGAQAYLEAIPEARGNTLAAWAIPFLLAAGTIRELRARPDDVLAKGDVKVSRAEVHALIERFGQGVDSSELGEIRRRIETEPLA